MSACLPSNHCFHSNQWLKELKVAGKDLSVKIDTGAEVSVMSKATLLGLGKNVLTRISTVLSGYGGCAIRVLGKCDLSVELADGKCTTTTFYVTESSDTVTLLGVPAITALGLVSVHSLKVSQYSQLISQYALVFEGLGQIPGEVSLQLKEGATTKSIPPRQVPLLALL